jgi:hypothetical protein
VRKKAAVAAAFFSQAKRIVRTREANNFRRVRKKAAVAAAFSLVEDTLHTAGAARAGDPIVDPSCRTTASFAAPRAPQLGVLQGNYR